jgi:hypothetical protein
MLGFITCMPYLPVSVLCAGWAGGGSSHTWTAVFECEDALPSLLRMDVHWECGESQMPEDNLAGIVRRLSIVDVQWYALLQIRSATGPDVGDDCKGDSCTVCREYAWCHTTPVASPSSKVCRGEVSAGAPQPSDPRTLSKAFSLATCITPTPDSYRRKNPTPVQIDADHFKLMLMASNRCNCRSI